MLNSPEKMYNAALATLNIIWLVTNVNLIVLVVDHIMGKWMAVIAALVLIWVVWHTLSRPFTGKQPPKSWRDC